MAFCLTFRKVAYVVFLIFFSACCRKPAPWQIERTTTRCPQYDSAKIFYCSPSPICGLNIEFVRNQSGLRAYLNLSICPVQPDDQNSQAIAFDCIAESAHISANGFVLQGGQRILLDETAADFVIRSFMLGESVTFVIGMYEETILPVNFSSVYEQSFIPCRD